MDAGAYVSSLGALLSGSSLIAKFVIRLLKETGVPVPVPADLRILGAGVQAALGRYTLLELALTLELAVVVGCSVQFLAVRVGVSGAERGSGQAPEGPAGPVAILRGRLASEGEAARWWTPGGGDGDQP